MLHSDMTESSRRARRGLRILIAILAIFLFTSAPPRPGLAQQAGARPTFSLASSEFPEGGFIPSRYTCSGQNVSPELRWNDSSARAVTFAVIVTDPDAPAGTWTHWVAYNLPAGSRQLPDAVPEGNQIQSGGVQGMNDFHHVGYGGPCPPPGKPHRYFFTLYALNTRLGLRPGATRNQVEQAMKGHVLAQAQLMGLYGR
ncbi:MAG: YbhB/YbcL family Raf kinase inhibitor-like protein [Terriglobia bacterium]